MKTSAFLVRRARLLLGLTQAAMADKFGVEPSTISRWERGIVEPAPKTLSKFRDIAASHDPYTSKNVVAASPVFKYLAPMTDLGSPVLLSKGLLESLIQIGAISSFEEFLTDPSEISKIWAKPDNPNYERSFSKAIALIQEEPRWLRGEIAFVEIHAYAKVAERWARGLVAPIPEEGLALVEGVPDPKAGDVTFWVRFSCSPDRI